MAEPTVLSGWTGTLTRALDDHGIDGRALARTCGVSTAALDDPTARIPLAVSTRLWGAAVDVTGDESFGIVVSRYVRPASYHALGHAFTASTTLREALDRTARFGRLTSDTNRTTVELTSTDLTVTFGREPGSARPAAAATDAVISSIVRSARFMLGRRLAPLRVRLARSRPEPDDRHHQFFGCPLTFGAPVSSLCFDRATVEEPVPGASPALASASDATVAAYLASLPALGASPASARHVGHVLAGCFPGPEPTVLQVANALGVSPRTLQRQLAADGTTFRRLLAEARHVRAVRALRAGDRSVGEIAHDLGFSETAAFSRAFRAWTGVPPSRFREAAEAEDDEDADVDVATAP